jgi:starvation-inducible DNA-binding protein
MKAHGHNQPGASDKAYHLPEAVRFRYMIDKNTGKTRKVPISADTDSKSAEDTVGGKHLGEDKVAALSKLMEATINPSEQALSEALKQVLADSFALYLKSHNFHWNVEGPDFAQYHDFLGDFYAEVFGAVDPIAETIKLLGDTAPGSMAQFREMTRITESVSTPPSPRQMMVELLADNAIVINSLKVAYKLAEAVVRVGISNFIQDRLAAHEKHEWMLRSLTKGGEPIAESASNKPTGIKMHFVDKKGKPFHEIHFTPSSAESLKKQHAKAGHKFVKSELVYEQEDATQRGKERDAIVPDKETQLKRRRMQEILYKVIKDT